MMMCEAKVLTCEEEERTDLPVRACPGRRFLDIVQHRSCGKAGRGEPCVEDLASNALSTSER